MLCVAKASRASGFTTTLIAFEKRSTVKEETGSLRVQDVRANEFWVLEHKTETKCCLLVCDTLLTCTAPYLFVCFLGSNVILPAFKTSKGGLSERGFAVLGQLCTASHVLLACRSRLLALLSPSTFVSSPV
jgi:hypothetical protein